MNSKRWLKIFYSFKFFRSLFSSLICIYKNRAFPKFVFNLLLLTFLFLYTHLLPARLKHDCHPPDISLPPLFNLHNESLDLSHLKLFFFCYCSTPRQEPFWCFCQAWERSWLCWINFRIIKDSVRKAQTGTQFESVIISYLLRRKLSSSKG